ncbi:site-specific integrase [Spartinivicinus ruber]|uniref:site-specific integrase n=1 Tax=Spartinivicinus ruber TaxID=2683272 RepID=UPI0013D2B3E7|nr:site-specific integrase [Spartinivicinus ruber]
MRNLVLRGTTYHYRKVLPKNLQKVIQKREITFSLHTKAKRLAHSKAFAVQAAVESSIYEMQRLTCREQQKNVYRELVVYIKTFQATGKIKKLQPVIVAPVLSEQLQEEPCLTLEEVYALFLKEKKKMDWGKRSAENNLPAFKCLIDILGNLEVKKVTKNVAIDFVQELYDYPVKRSRGKNKNLSLASLKEKGVPTIAPTTALKMLNYISGFFNWMQRRDYIKANPFSGLKPRAKHITAKTKEAFTTSELRTLFGHYLNKDSQLKKIWQFWIPALALFTGARLEELAQLNVADIKQAGDIYYLDINDCGTHQLKNKASIRKIPLHDLLMSIEFLDYVDSQEGQTKLFALTLNGGLYGKSVTSWFSKLKRQIGFPPSKVFHSFRHTFRDLAVESRVPSEHIKALLGHAQGDMTHGVYGSGFSLKLLNESMQQIDFSCVRDILVKD